jgi:hypothetical protein
LVLLAIAVALAVLVACVLVVPRLLHPPLSASDLRDVPSADRRVELQQAQARLQNDLPWLEHRSPDVSTAVWLLADGHRRGMRQGCTSRGSTCGPPISRTRSCRVFR